MFRKIQSAIVCFTLGLASAVSAQKSTQSTPIPSPTPATPQYGCNSPESKQFDFWLGDWEFTSQGSRGANRVTKILGGCVILENFGDGTADTLNGQSISTFDRATKKWKQTWVDNGASYLDFTGGMADGKVISDLVKSKLQN